MSTPDEKSPLGFGEPADLLARALEGELSDEEAQRLRTLTEQPEARDQMRAWVRQDQFGIVLERMFPRADAGEKKRRLLAAAVVRGKRHASTRARAPRWWIRFGLAGAFAAAAIAIFITMDPGSSNRLTVSGSHELWRGDEQVIGAGPVPGDRLVAGARGVQIDLGRYHTLKLTAGAAIVFRDSDQGKAIELQLGRVTSSIQPGHGGFRIETPLGEVKVLGTRFTTEVMQAGDAGAGTSVAGPRVQVSVQEGKVQCRMGGSTHILTAGDTQTFGAPQVGPVADVGQVGQTSGTVETVSANGREAVVTTPRGRFNLIGTGRGRNEGDIGQLVHGDSVTIDWKIEDGVVMATGASGDITGRVTAKGRTWIEISSEGRPARRFRVVWAGGMPDKGGGYDPRMVERLAQVNPGTMVEIHWLLSEDMRVNAIRVLE